MKKMGIFDKKFDNNIAISNKNFQKVLLFYLFECPVPGKSVRGKKFLDYGWHGSKKFSVLKKRMLELSSNLNRDKYLPCEKSEIENKLKFVNELVATEEFCVFLKYDEKTIIQSFFSSVRNALAHGSFVIRLYENTRVYYFENHDKYLKASIVLHETTLLQWIKLIKGEEV